MIRDTQAAHGGPPHERAATSAAGPGRRTMLTAGGGLALTALLGGCRVRLEDDAPRIPLIPTRTPIPDEALLILAWRECTELARVAATLAALQRLQGASLHTEQAETLRSVLATGRVPDSVVSASPAPTTGREAPGAATPGSTSEGASGIPSGGPAGGGGGVRTATEAGALELGPLRADRRSGLGAVTPTHAALWLSMLACRSRLAAQLGVATPWQPWPEQPADGEATFLQQVRGTLYAMQVVAVRTSGAARERATADLTWLDALRIRLESRAGSALGAPPVGYALPFPVTDGPSAARLAAHAWSGLQDASGALLVAGSGDAARASMVVQLLTDVVAHGSAWGVRLRAFPGLVR